MTVTVEFVELRLRNVLKFNGTQAIQFARPPHRGGRAVTLLLGGGASGKTCLLHALRLALWGAAEHSVDPVIARHRLPIINAGALAEPDPHASADLFLSIRDEVFERTETWRLSRTWRDVDGHGLDVAEELRLEVTDGEAATRYDAAKAESRVAAVLPRDRSPLVWLSGAQLDDLGSVATKNIRRRARGRNQLLSLVRARSAPCVWTHLAPQMKAFFDRATGRVTLSAMYSSPLWLSQTGDTNPNRRPLIPGLWAKTPLEEPSEILCLGTGLAHAFATSGQVQGPLLLDGPLVSVEPKYAPRYLRSLATWGPWQQIVTAHESEAVHEAARQWDASQIVYLVEDRWSQETRLLGEALWTRGAPSPARGQSRGGG